MSSSANTASLLRQTLELLKAKLAQTEDVLGFQAEPKPVINCVNGEVWIGPKGTRKLKPHSPKSFLRDCLNVTYDPDAKCPEYDKALRGIFAKAENPNRMASFWNELLGYIIQPRRNIPLVLILYGQGDNGKTVLMNTVVQLLGRELVCAQPVETFDKSRFAMSNLFGKRLFLDDDVRAGVRLPDGIVKTISEAKTVTGELKFGPNFNFTVRAVPTLLCNNVPSIADLSHGLLRRLTVIPFQRTFTKKEKDRTLFDRIWATELPGVLNRALDGLGRLARRQWQLPTSVDVQAATNRFVKEANPLPAFVEEYCEIGGDESCWLPDFYRQYCDWAESNGSPGSSKNNRCVATSSTWAMAANMGIGGSSCLVST